MWGGGNKGYPMASQDWRPLLCMFLCGMYLHILVELVPDSAP